MLTRDKEGKTAVTLQPRTAAPHLKQRAWPGGSAKGGRPAGGRTACRGL